MGTRYRRADDDTCSKIDDVRCRYHHDLESVRIDVLFAYGAKPDEQVLSHNGYPVIATVKITRAKDRALGYGDALIVVDRASWGGLTDAQKDAVIDHELTHLLTVFDKAGRVDVDYLGRPKLEMRMHDHQFGWFDAVAKRHGENSMEVFQARGLMAKTGQLYISFEAAEEMKRENETVVSISTGKGVPVETTLGNLRRIKARDMAGVG